MLREIVYVLGPETLRRATIAVTVDGVFLRHPGGIEAVPVGVFYREIRPDLYIPAGYDLVPAVAPDVLFRALGSPAFPGSVPKAGRARGGVPGDGFVPLDAALIEPQRWVPVAPSATFEAALTAKLPEVFLGGVGIHPLRDVPTYRELARPHPQLLPERTQGDDADD